jgi:hypothetical protein
VSPICRLRYTLQIVEREDPTVVTISPCRLEPVTADLGQPNQLKRTRIQWLLWPAMQPSHDVHLAFTARAGTPPPQLFQGDETFAAIVPPDGQFTSDLLNLLRSHAVALAAVRCAVKQRGYRQAFFSLVHVLSTL